VIRTRIEGVRGDQLARDADDQEQQRRRQSGDSPPPLPGGRAREQPSQQRDAGK
jgi:hypothetical protein